MGRPEGDGHRVTVLHGLTTAASGRQLRGEELVTAEGFLLVVDHHGVRSEREGNRGCKGEKIR